MSIIADRRSRVVAAVGALLAATLLTGCGASPEAVTTSTTPAAPVATGGVPTSVSPAPGISPLPPVTPRRITVPAIGVDSTLIPLGLNPDETIEVPPLAQPKQAGYYRYAPTPGAKGPAVILGHIDGNGQKGVFYRLQEMTPGQQINVTRDDGNTAVFTVSTVQRAPKTNFPTQQVYGPTPDAQLRLISCGGALDRQAHSYLDNIIVYATLSAVHAS